MKPKSPKLSCDSAQLVEDVFKLGLCQSLLRDISADSVSDIETVDDRRATELLFIGTQQQVRAWLRSAQTKLRKIYAS